MTPHPGQNLQGDFCGPTNLYQKGSRGLEVWDSVLSYVPLWLDTLIFGPKMRLPTRVGLEGRTT